MNVRELIEALGDYGDHLEVYVGDDDFWYDFSLGTEVVNGLTAVVIGQEDQVDSD